jgi:acetoin utilization deacetylase AcuC-like enzyme
VPTAYISHAECRKHDTGPGHPEEPRRLSAIEDKFVETGLHDVLRHIDAPEVTLEQLLRVHNLGYLEALDAAAPESGYVRLDPDTVISPGSLQAARRAAGAVIAAVEGICNGDLDSAFCGVRPPGHHAERERATGFCLYNNIAVGVAHALATCNVERVAVVDFDVHHCNGTEDIFKDEDRVLVCSTFQHPFYPFTPLLPDAPSRVSVPLDASAKSEEFRDAVTNRWLPALERFKPQMVFVSAGFDAHRDDEMSHVSLTDADFRWVSEQIMVVADEFAGGRVISVLEGGYELFSLARCADSHIRVLMGLT